MRSAIKMTCGQRARRAFTVVELLVVVAIILLVASVAVASVIPFMEGRKLNSATRTLQAGLMRARSYAANQRTRATMRIFPGEGKAVIYRTIKAAEMAEASDDRQYTDPITGNTVDLLELRAGEPLDLPQGVSFWTPSADPQSPVVSFNSDRNGVPNTPNNLDGSVADQHESADADNNVNDQQNQPEDTDPIIVFHPSGSLDPVGMGRSTSNWYLVFENQQNARSAIEIMFSTGMTRIHEL